MAESKSDPLKNIFWFCLGLNADSYKHDLVINWLVFQRLDQFKGEIFKESRLYLAINFIQTQKTR